MGTSGAISAIDKVNKVLRESRLGEPPVTEETFGTSPDEIAAARAMEALAGSPAT